MIGRHVRGALDRIARTPVSTGANILTLALGLAAFILAWGVVSYWQSSDGHFANAGRIVAITQQFTQDDGRGSGVSLSTAQPVAKYLREDVPELEAVARLGAAGEMPVNTGDRIVPLQGVFAEADLLGIFDFDFLAGDPARALEPVDSIILTQASAEKLFGAEPAMGRRVILDGKYNVTVTGVIAPIPQPSHMGDVADAATRFDYISAWPRSVDQGPENWLSVRFATYALLPADGSLTLDTFRHRLSQLDERRIPSEQRDVVDVAIDAIPVSEIQAHRLDYELFGELSGRLGVVEVLFGLGLMVLAVACLNYANLATAQAVSRGKQIGMRRMLGASHTEIAVQTFTESALLTLIALVLALVTCWFAAPVIQAQTGVDLAAALFANPGFIGVATALVVGVALAAGAYPAFVLTRVRPVDAIRSGKARSAPRFVSQTLVGLQFATASVLLIAVIVLGQQNAFLQRAGSSDGDQLVMLGPASLTGVSAKQLAERVRAIPEIRQVTEMDHLPWTLYSNLALLSRSPEAGAAEKTPMMTGVGVGYFDAFGFKVLAGRVYEEGRDLSVRARASSPSGSNASRATEPLVIDRALSEELGFASPQAAVGQVIHVAARIARFAPGQGSLEIIGVVENTPQHFMSSGTDGNAYRIDDGAPANMPVIRVARGQEERAMAALREAWDSFSPLRPFDPIPVRDLFDEGFKRFAQTSGLFQGLSLLAFLISATGLFGMAVHVIQRRRHEIGVRKTLGSTALRVVALLIRDFSRPVVIANILAWPIGYLAAQAYLSSFMRRVDLTFAPFILSFAITLAIAWIVVGAQTIRAANLRPAEVLRRS